MISFKSQVLKLAHSARVDAANAPPAALLDTGAEDAAGAGASPAPVEAAPLETPPGPGGGQPGGLDGVNDALAAKNAALRAEIVGLERFERTQTESVA